MTRHRFLQLDVFTGTPLTGNQLAVFLDGSAIDPVQMPSIAREMAFPETTFVLPAERPGTDVRVRIFTPAVELPMAGHPTVGTAFALARVGRIATGQPRITFDLGIGPTRVRLEWADERLEAAWMSQPVPVFGRPMTDLEQVARALGVDANDIRSTGLPVQEATAGVPFLYVPLASRGAVDRAELDRAALQRLCDAAGLPERPVFLFSLEPGDDGGTAYSRMFGPVLGVAEDPATGAASGPLGGYLAFHRAVTDEQARNIVSVQGVKMGRPSRVHIAVVSRDTEISAVEVGGSAVTVAEGELLLP